MRNIDSTILVVNFSTATSIRLVENNSNNRVCFRAGEGEKKRQTLKGLPYTDSMGSFAALQSTTILLKQLLPSFGSLRESCDIFLLARRRIDGRAKISDPRTFQRPSLRARWRQR